jgi:hypothetical protein
MFEMVNRFIKWAESENNSPAGGSIANGAIVIEMDKVPAYG